MLLSRVLRPFLSALPYQAATFFPEKKDPPYWLENLTKPGHEKPFKNIYPRVHKVEKLKLLPGDEPQPYEPFIRPITYKQRKQMKQDKRKREKREKNNIVTEDEVKIVVVANNILGRWRKLHPITKQINKKPLDHAILQCHFNREWSPRYRDVMLALLQARRIAREGGVTDTSDLWVDFATCARHIKDKNGITVHAKGRTGSLVRHWCNISITVVKGRPVKKSDKLKERDFPDHYRKYLPPIRMHEETTMK